jgi:transposase InsO family protein
MAVEDVFSRYILAWTLSPTQMAGVAADLIGEEIYQRDYDDPIEAFRSIRFWIEKYNHTRPHQALNYRVPAGVYAKAALTKESTTT